MFANFILPALMGWAGSSITGKPADDDDSPIGPWGPVFRIAIGIVGGMAGGFVASQFVGTEQLATTGLLSLAGGSILTDLGQRVKLIR